jgi:hypothetical protein
VNLTWRKSSYTGNGDNGDCVEVAFADKIVAIRDSKKPEAGMLTLPESAWAAFLTTGRPQQH